MMVGNALDEGHRAVELLVEHDPGDLVVHHHRLQAHHSPSAVANGGVEAVGPSNDEHHVSL
jgi:hypothetical protein